MGKPIQATLVFPTRDKQVLLGMKKRGFGEGWWNGFGGKLDAGETFEAGARRETYEESSLTIGTLHQAARLLFYYDNKLKFVCMVFTSQDFSGIPKEGEEMRPKWFPVDKLPFEKMWSDDPAWLPQVLAHKPNDPILNFAIYLDAKNNFLRIEDRDDEQVADYFGVSNRLTGSAS